MKRYFKQYKWSNLLAMIRNLNHTPLVCPLDFKNSLVVITGATSGIGYATAHKFASHGADILSINRNPEKSIALCNEIKQQYGINCDYIIADFSKLSDIHSAAKRLKDLDREIDVLIHNAGVYNTKRMLDSDSIEMVFKVNYLATFIINYYLIDKLKEQDHGRVLFVNSEAHRFAAWGLHLDDLCWETRRYSGGKSYGSAKLAQLLSMLKFNELFTGSGITINAMHPGNVKTNSGQNNNEIYKFFKKIFVDSTAKNAEVSAEALYYLGVSDAVKKKSGKFFNLTTEEEPAPPALDRNAAEELWNKSLELGKLN